jgi:hypothetical protein
MVARLQCLVVPLAVLLLTAASARAQDVRPAEQPASEPVWTGEASVPNTSGPMWDFQADWLGTVHAKLTTDTRSFIAGPDTASFNDLPDLSCEDGYRLKGNVRLGNWIIEGVYSYYGGCSSWLNESVDGVAFNASALAGNWTGRNSLNASTYFSPIFSAASLPPTATTPADQTGLGPSNSFLNDTRPLLMTYMHSDFYMAEANIKWADYIVPTFGGGGLRLGVGYVSADLKENAWVALSGSFADVTNGAPGTATLGLSNSVLTSYNGGNLALYSGGGTGFSDGTNNGTGIPSQVLFTHQATTSNHFNGAQLLLDGDLVKFWHMDIGGTFRGGIFDNFAEGRIVETYQEMNNDLSSYGREFSDSCHHVAFLGGVGLNAGYHLTDEITVRAGYEVLYLSNLALAPEQVNGIAGPNVYHVQMNGTAVIQAAHAGLEIAF